MTHPATQSYGKRRIAPMLSVNEAARVLAVERSTIYRLLAAGELQKCARRQTKPFPARGRRRLPL